MVAVRLESFRLMVNHTPREVGGCFSRDGVMVTMGFRKTRAGWRLGVMMAGVLTLCGAGAWGQQSLPTPEAVPVSAPPSAAPPAAAPVSAPPAAPQDNGAAPPAPADAAAHPPEGGAPGSPHPVPPLPDTSARQAALLVETLRDPARREALIAELSVLAGKAAPAAPVFVPVPVPVAAPAAAAPSPAAPAAAGAAPAPAGAPATPPATTGEDGATTLDDTVETLSSRLLTILTDHIEDLSEELADAGQALVDAPRALRWLDHQVSDPALRQQWTLLIGELLLVLCAGYLGRFLAVRALARPRRSLERRGHRNLATRLVLLVARTLLDSLPVLAFLASAYGVLSFTHPPRLMGMAALGIIMASLLVQAIMLAGRFLLSPGSAALRLIQVGDESANYAYIWLRRIALTAVYGYFVAQVAAKLGLPPKPYSALLKLVGLMVGVMLVIVVLQNRLEVGEWLRGTRRRDEPPGPPPTLEEGALEASLAAEGSGEGLTAAPAAPGWAPLDAVRHRIADIWHVLTILYLLVLYGIWALDVKGGFEFVARATVVSLAVLAIARVVVEGIDHLIRRGFAVPPELQRQYPGLEARANRYLPLLQRVGKGGTWVLATLIILQAWGVDSFGWLATPFGRRASAALVTMALAVVVALVIWEGVSSQIERYLSGVDQWGQPRERSARARTLLPLLRNALLVFLVVTVGLIILSELGMDIGPLLAGAGVIGVAVGFGSQTLVKDLITGLFILFEDTIAVGDVINLGGGLAGVVEGLSIRTIRLRDDTGALHTVPFSSVGAVSNQSKGFNVYALTLAVDYRENPEKVMGVLRQIGTDLTNDPTFGPYILTPLDVLGVAALGDGAMKIKASVKTRPGRKETVGRELNRQIKERFDAAGIALASSSPTIIVTPAPGAVPPAPASSSAPSSAPAPAPAAPQPSGQTDPT